MKKFLLIAVIVLLMPSVAWSAEKEQQYSPEKAKVIVNGKQLVFDQDPVMINDRIFVPVRAIVESLGGAVEWQDPGFFKIITAGGETNIGINQTRGYQNRQIFFMEQPPVIINNRTMVPLRLFEVLGASVTWDAEKGVAAITSDGNLVGSKQPVGDQKPAESNYYKLYDLLAGDSLGESPTLEAAKKYVQEKKLFKSIKDAQYTPIGYFEGEDGKGNPMFTVGGYAAIIIGNDESDDEKAVWLTKNPYTGYIETENIIASVLLKDGISQDTAISILENKGVKREDIKKIYFAPHRNHQILWFAIVEEKGEKYFYCLDYFTGETVVERQLFCQPPQ